MISQAVAKIFLCYSLARNIKYTKQFGWGKLLYDPRNQIFGWVGMSGPTTTASLPRRQAILRGISEDLL